MTIDAKTCADGISAMVFDITSDDITALNDKDLRELVAKLCEA